MRMHVAAVGLSGPGLEDWNHSAPVLCGKVAYRYQAYHFSGRSPLAGPERRRATAITRLALEAAVEAAGDDRSGWNLPTVFASSGGEVDTCDVLFEALASQDRSLSPTQFHNSVHNAASGYWGIASGSHQPSVSVAGFDTTFVVGLLEAAALLDEGATEVLLIAYDGPPPFPIAPFRPLLAPFAVALRLNSDSAPGRAALSRLDLRFDSAPGAVPTPMSDGGLEALRCGNPAARALPLLAAIAGGRATGVVLESSGSVPLRIDVTPCP